MKAVSTILYIGSLLLLVSSCTQEPYEPQSSTGEGLITFTLYNSSGEAQPTRATRSIDVPAENEKAINRMDIFFYDKDGSNCIYYPDNITIVGDKVTIRVPDDKMTSLQNEADCQVYVVANCHLDRSVMDGKTLREIKELVLTNSSDRAFNAATAPVDFFMDSEVLTVNFSADLPNQNLGKVLLKRAAAKVLVDIINANISGYTPSTVTATIVNYLDKTVLGTEYQYNATPTDYKTGSKTLIPQNDVNHAYLMDAANPMYTYANNWENSPEKETYVLIALDWINNATAQTKTYYYRIPFSYIRATTGDADANKNKIRRNYIYQFAVNISKLGGLDPSDAMDIRANFDLVNWQTKEVEVSILEYHFLFVYNPKVEVHNTPLHEWEYKSSRDISIRIDDVYCFEYKPDGSINRKDYSISEEQYPDIEPIKRNDRTYLKFKSVVPINYVPLYVNATVINSAGLSTPISITIYPKIYVTASYSYGGYQGYGDAGIIQSGSTSAVKDGQTIWLAGSYTTPTGGTSDISNNSPNGEMGQKNFNFFTVHVTSLDIEDEIEGVFIGDPTEGIDHPGSTAGGKDNRDVVATGYNSQEWHNFVGRTYFRTQILDEYNKTISPQFVIATQRGITSSSKSWEIAQQRCATYRESQYVAGSWRMPTLAELKLVRRMQLDPNSAIKDLFVFGTTGASSGWWTAQYGASVILDNPNDAEAILIGKPEISSSVRCVRDMWRD